MVIMTIQDDIFNSKMKHIAFAINIEGYNDAGFAGQVAKRYWPELAFCGYHELGTVLSKTIGNKTFHALVCHSLKNGWGKNQREVIKECFDKIPVNNEQVASIAIGTGLAGIVGGADFRQIVCGMHDSKQQIILHTNYTLDAVMNCYNEENKRLKKQKRKR